MKSSLISALALTGLLSSSLLHAQDSSAHAAAASADASAAGSQSTLAVAASAATGIRAASGVAAIPLWMISSTTGASAAVSKQIASGSWDAAHPACTARPKLNNEVGAPPKHDPSPAEAMKSAAK